MSKFAEAWERYKEQLVRVGAEANLKSLNPGCSESAFADFEKATGVVLPEEGKELYRMHNGQLRDPFPIGHLFPMGFFLPLEEVADTSNALWSNIEGEDELTIDYKSEDPRIADGFFAQGWLPFLDDGGGDYDCMDTNPGDQGTVGQILTYFHDCDNEFNATSLSAYLDQECRKLVTGEWIYDARTGDFAPQGDH